MLALCNGSMRFIVVVVVVVKTVEVIAQPSGHCESTQFTNRLNRNCFAEKWAKYTDDDRYKSKVSSYRGILFKRGIILWKMIVVFSCECSMKRVIYYNQDSRKDMDRYFSICVSFDWASCPRLKKKSNTSSRFWFDNSYNPFRESGLRLFRLNGNPFIQFDFCSINHQSSPTLSFSCSVSSLENKYFIVNSLDFFVERETDRQTYLSIKKWRPRVWHWGRENSSTFTKQNKPLLKTIWGHLS